MKKLICFFLLIFVPVFAQAAMTQAELQELLKDRIDGLQFLTRSALLLDAVRDQNRQHMTLDQIKKIDKEWIAGTSPLIKELQENKVGKFLKNIIVQQSDTYSEVFLTDNQGANVACYPATSDYWQGDEEKFTDAFAGGKGAIYIGSAAYDDSSKTNSVQISVPMIYNKKAIGVLIIGVKLSVLEAETMSKK